MSGVISRSPDMNSGIVERFPDGHVLQKIHVSSIETNSLGYSSWTNIYETSLVLKSSSSKMTVEFDVSCYLDNATAGGGVRIYRNTSATITSSHTLVTPVGPYPAGTGGNNPEPGADQFLFMQNASGALRVPVSASGEDSLSGLTKGSTIYYAMLAKKTDSNGTFEAPVWGNPAGSKAGSLNIILTEVQT